MTSTEGEKLAAPLRQQFDVVETEAIVGGRSVILVRPRSADDLLDEATFDLDGKIPYWCELWPSSRVLAAELAKREGRGRRLLELGCGVGLVAIAALSAGYEVLATDYYEEALAFTELNAARNSMPTPQVRLVDWRALPTDLGTFDLVVAADVLYERDYAALVAATFAATLSPTGRGLLADPGRRHAATFTDECQRLGLKVRSHARVPFDECPPHCTIDLYELSQQ